MASKGVNYNPGEQGSLIDISSQSRDEYESLVQQVQNEYALAYDVLRPKLTSWRTRLRLYNNQKRDPEAVGDPLLFTIFQTLLASLYTDRLDANWLGREEGDDETAENLNSLAEFDYDEMKKEIVDYQWIWDTLFFGRGLLGMYEFKRDPDKNIFHPTPEVYNPMNFLRDPDADSVNGDSNNKGAARFFGREIAMTKREMKDNGRFFDIDKVKGGIDTESLKQLSKEARAEAQGLQTDIFSGNDAALKENESYEILQWFTHWRGKKTIVWLANERQLPIRVEQDIPQDHWRVIDRPLYPTAHDWDGTSIPDLTEDKQRARAVAQNLGLKMMKADLLPMYLYDTNKITNKNDLNFDFNKFVGVDGQPGDAIFPMRKGVSDKGLLDFIFNSLDVSAQKATATPEIQQGMVSEQDRTLGEINIVASKADTRYSLAAKVFGWSEKAFWREWYGMYKEHFEDDIDEKIIRIKGAFGAEYRPLSKEDIETRIDPDVEIESSTISNAKRIEERAALLQYLGLIAQDPNTNRRYGFKKLGKLFGFQKDELDRLLPPTTDERIAERQNEQLNKNETVPVLATDDHQVHLEYHSKAKDTPATRAHIRAHEEALSIKKQRPDLFPADEQAPDVQVPGINSILPSRDRMQGGGGGQELPADRTELPAAE